MVAHLHPRARQNAGLVFLAFPRYFGLKDAVSGAVGSLYSQTVYKGDRITSNAVTGNGIHWPWPGRINSITRAWSMLFYGNFATLNNYCQLIGVCSSTSSVVPILLYRNSGTSQLRIDVQDGTNWHSSNSNTNAVITGEVPQLYAVTYDRGSVTFYKNGTAWGTATQSDVVPDWRNKLGVAVLGFMPPNDVNGGAVGSFVMAAIYNRALKAAEVAAIARNPAHVVEDAFVPALYNPPPPPPVPTASFAASPESGDAPLTVQFVDTSTSTIDSRAWDYTDNGSTDSTIQNPQTTYTTPGTYTVRLTVTNVSGSDTTTRSITVNAPPPPPVVPGITYVVEMDFGRDGTYGHAQSAITSRVEQANWSAGMTSALQEFAGASTLSLTMDNSDGAWSPDAAGATYHGLLVPGVLIRIRAQLSGTWYTLWQGKVSDIDVTPGGMANESGGLKQVSISAEDPMKELLKAEYVPELLLNVRTDEALRALFDAGVFVWPYSKSFFTWDISRWDVDRWFTDNLTAFDEGYTTLTWAGDNLDRGNGVSGQSYLRPIVESEGGRFYWDGRTGKFTFHNRYRDNQQPVAAALADSVVGVKAAFGKDMANVVTVQYEPRSIGAANSIIWQIDAPFMLSPGQTRTLKVRYRDEAAREAKISAINIQNILAGDIGGYLQTGPKVNSTDPTPPLGDDVTSHIAVNVAAKASSADITLINTMSANVWVTVPRLRGTPLTTLTRDEARVSDSASIEAYDRRELLIHMKAVDDPLFAQGIAGVHLQRSKSPRNVWERATMKAGYLMANDAAAQLQVVSRQIGDRVTMSDPWSEHEGEYIIVGERHSVDSASGLHEVSWTLKPVYMEHWFRWDISRWDGGDVFAL